MYQHANIILLHSLLLILTIDWPTISYNELSNINYPSKNNTVGPKSIANQELIKENLDLGQPIIHDGFDSDGGHAWNVDGYDDDDNFHMNWGWGGSSNGWFTVDNLVAGGWSMNDDRSILVNISP